MTWKKMAEIYEEYAVGLADSVAYGIRLRLISSILGDTRSITVADGFFSISTPALLCPCHIAWGH